VTIPARRFLRSHPERSGLALPRRRPIDLSSAESEMLASEQSHGHVYHAYYHACLLQKKIPLRRYRLVAQCRNIGAPAVQAHRQTPCTLLIPTNPWFYGIRTTLGLFMSCPGRNNPSKAGDNGQDNFNIASDVLSPLLSSKSVPRCLSR